MADSNTTIQFKAEVKEVTSKKTASLDVGYKVVLYTDDPSVLRLGAMSGDTYFDVAIGVGSE